MSEGDIRGALVFRPMLLLALALGAQAQARDGSPPIEISVDATQISRKIVHIQLVIPAEPGELTLLYPKWIPGYHSPEGPAEDLMGLRISSEGRVIPWQRDELDMYAVHCQVPPHTRAITVDADFVSAPASASWGAFATDNLAIVEWHQLVLYPSGPSMGEIMLRADLSLPSGWQLGTALPIERPSGKTTRFGQVSLETLIDSPVLCGKHFRSVDIGPPGTPSHAILMAADSEEALEFPPEWKASCDRLVAEAGALFGAWHYDSYRFLLAMSDHITHYGLEHHESSDNRVGEGALTDDTLRLSWMGSYLLPHEFVHSWNGKHRRPLDMVTENYNQPQRTKLLWVYEGLTTYLHWVLTTRCGLWSQEQGLEYLAYSADRAQNRKGRAWRPLVDTAVAAQLLYEARGDWAAWRRGVDFYVEGALIWLEIDTIIRQQTDGRRSLDDFCRRFLGEGTGGPGVKPYTLADVVAELHAVAPHDWEALLESRLTSTDPDAPLGGVHRGGWRLTYGEEPTEVFTAFEVSDEITDLRSSIGLILDADGSVTDIIPGEAAHSAGMGPGGTVVAVNGRRWSPSVLRRAVAATGKGGQPLELLIESGEFFTSYNLEYEGGARYPRLERDASREDLLTQILTPLAAVDPK
ncbi:M61 family metallopeptidase [Candidatus Latescibacterota bacterium]